MTKDAILVVGSINMDQIVQVARLPRLGETLVGNGSLKLIPGGKGANQAVAIARLGARVQMAGRIGTDSFGRQSLQALRDAGVETDLVLTDEQEASGVAFIFITTTDRDNAIIVAPGANQYVGTDQEHYAQIVAVLKKARALVLQLEIPTKVVNQLIKDAHQAGIPVFLNLAPAQQLPRTTLKQVSVLILNENEASVLSGQKIESVEDARIVATVLHTYGIPTVVITLGASGAVLVTEDTSGKVLTIHKPAPHVNVVDTTAAGDCFVGALTVALTEGQKPAEALQFAIYASARKVTSFGAQPGLPTRAEVHAFLQDQQA